MKLVHKPLTPWISMLCIQCSASILALLLPALSSCMVYPSQAYYPRPARYPYPPPRPQHPSSASPRFQSQAFRLAANGHSQEAHAAAARGEGTEDDVRRGEKLHHDNQIAAAAAISVIGAAIIAGSAGGSSQQPAERPYDPRPFWYTENADAKVDGRELPHPELEH